MTKLCTTIVLEVETTIEYDTLHDWPKSHAQAAAEMLLEHITTRCDVPYDSIQIKYCAVAGGGMVGEIDD